MDKRTIVKKIKYFNHGQGYKYIMECFFCHKQFQISGYKYNEGKGKYCSLKCSYNKESWNKGKKGLQISWNKGKIGKLSKNWKNGKKHDRNGYIYIYTLEHPFRNCDNRVAEHRLVAEKILGRYLTKIEIIHHINKITNDNCPENLYLFPNKILHGIYHSLIKSKKIKPITKSNLNSQPSVPKFGFL